MISFTPNDEQQLIIETVRRYATERVRPAAHDADESGATPAAIVETGWELGLLPSALPGIWDSLRISLGWSTTDSDVENLLCALTKVSSSLLKKHENSGLSSGLAA